MITIKNLRNEKPKEEWDVKVDRSSPLGNIFLMKDYTNEERTFVCNKYEDWFWTNFLLCENKPFNDELHRIQDIYLWYGKINLFCWCAPRQCHAETIKRHLESLHLIATKPKTKPESLLKDNK